MDLGVIVLAAGQGTRMRSALPKVMHKLAAKPLLAHVLDTAARLNPRRTAVVYGHGGEHVMQYFSDRDVQWAEQSEQLGTGHAVLQAMHLMQDVKTILVLYGDVPLTSLSTLERLLTQCQYGGLGVLTVRLKNPHGYGRMIRNSNGVIERIIEQKDANESQLAIDEINTGIMVFERTRLHDWLHKIDNNNAQGEYYLTDVIGLAVTEGMVIASAQPESEEEVLGVNDRSQLALLERYYQTMQANELMRCGVSLADPARLDLRGRLTTGVDVFIDVNAVIEGQVELGDGVTIGPNCFLKNCRIGNHTQIQSNCVIEDASVGEHAIIGPFARLRPDAVLADRVHVGNFVEIKKSKVGLGSKVNHLSYIGDSRIGSGVNVGAGTITCNYDGVNKHQTDIGDNAFIGSNASLVAPVTVGDGATIGAGSVICREAPADKLTLTRARQMSVRGWKRPQKQTDKTKE